MAGRTTYKGFPVFSPSPVSTGGDFVDDIARKAADDIEAVNDRITALDTDDLPEGSNLYFTNGRVSTLLAAGTVTNIVLAGGFSHHINLKATTLNLNDGSGSGGGSINVDGGSINMAQGLGTGGGIFNVEGGTINFGQGTITNLLNISNAGSAIIFLDPIDTDGNAISTNGGDIDLGSGEIYSDAITVGGGTPIVNVVSNTASLNFASLASGAEQSLTMALVGAVVGDSVIKGLPSTIESGIWTEMFVSAADTITVRRYNVTGASIDSPAATYRATIVRF